MTKVININHRGILTLPREMRRLGVNGNSQIIAEDGWSLLPMTQQVPNTCLAIGRWPHRIEF